MPQATSLGCQADHLSNRHQPRGWCLYLFAIAISLLAPLAAFQGVTPDPNRPIGVFVFDLAKNGYQLASPANGVVFDMTGEGKPTKIGWTAAGSDDGFLVLDLNGNGRIDSGREMVGNGWRRADGTRVLSGDDALSVIQGHEKRVEGGMPTHMAFVDKDDAVFARLRIWRDVNHNGRSDEGELSALPQLKIVNIYLGFRIMRRAQDPSGNTLLIEGSFDINQQGVDVTYRMMEVEFAGQK